MNLYSLIKVFLVIVLVGQYSFSQQSFFPHSVGNRWDYWQWDMPPSYTYSLTITRDSVGPDRSKFLFFNNAETPSYRIKGFNVYWAWGDLKYKLDAVIGEMWQSSTSGYIWYWLERIDTMLVFNRTTVVKVFQSGHGPPLWAIQEFWLAEGFGLIYEWGEPYHVLFLKGCVVDRDTFGSIVSIKPIELDNPGEFSLKQNYPNPFNPSTVISWQLPVSGHVSLKIFDLLGREVATLVDEFKQAGAYTATFDASNLPSGVYIYSLRVNDFVQHRKMTLLK